MRRVLPIIALAIATPAYADEGWDRIKHMEVAWQVLNAADFATTEYCLRRGTCHEGNPIIGSDPSTAKLAAYKIGTGALHYIIARHLADRDPKAARIFEIASIVVQGGVVVANLRFVF